MNPINAYSLIKKLANDWKTVRSINIFTNILTQHTKSLGLIFFKNYFKSFQIAKRFFKTKNF